MFFAAKNKRNRKGKAQSTELLFSLAMAMVVLSCNSETGDVDLSTQSFGVIEAADDPVVAIMPAQDPVIIQAGGGTIDYGIFVANQTAETVDLSLWTTLVYPDGTTSPLNPEPLPFVLPAGWDAEKDFSEVIDGALPAGQYTVSVQIGIWPDSVVSADGFDFEKLSETASQGWVLYSWPDRAPVLRSIHFADNNNGWIVGTRNTILHTSDGGDNWYAQSSNTSVNYAGVYFVDNQTGWAVGTGGKISHTSDGGESWALQSTPTSYTLNGVFFTDANTGWAVGGKSYSFTPPRGVILHTSDGGNSWETQLSQRYVLPFSDVFFANADTGWAISDGGVVYATTDGGENWAQQSTGVSASLKGVWFANPDTGWIVGTGGVLLKTVNGGASWVQQDLGAFETLNFSSVVFANDNEGWMSGGDGISGRIIHTTDGGNTWELQDTGDADFLYDITFTDALHGWAAGYYGSIVSTETGGV